MSASTPARSRSSSSDITIITTTRAINAPLTPPVSSPVISPSAPPSSLPRTLSHHHLPLSSPAPPPASSAYASGSWWGAVTSTVKFLSGLALEDDLPSTPPPVPAAAPATPRSQLSAQGRKRMSPPATSAASSPAPLTSSSSLSRGRSQTALPGLPRPVSLHHAPSMTATPPPHPPSSRSTSSPGSPVPLPPHPSASSSRAPQPLHPSPSKNGDKEEEDATPVDSLATSPPAVAAHRRVQSASSSSPFSVSPSLSGMAVLPPPAALNFSLANSAVQLRSFQRLQSIDVVEHIEADELGPQFSPVSLRHRAASARDEHSNGLLQALSSSSSGSEEKEEAASSPAPSTPAADSPTDAAAAPSSSSQSSSATLSAPSSPPLSSGSVTRNLRLSHFHRLLSEETLDIDALRQLSWHGVPAPVRADVWRLLLGYLPLSRARREGMLEKRRAEYLSFLRQHYATLHSTAPSSAPFTSAADSDPASSSAASVSASSSSPEAEIMSQILQDVPRTCPALPFFKLPAVQKSLERVLFIFSVRHPASGYVQGFNDLVTPFYSVFLSALLPHVPDPVSTLSSLPLSEAELLGLEADCLGCLSFLLSSIQDHYTFAQPGIQRCIYRLSAVVQTVAPALHAHLESEGVAFLHFAFRWMNCLLMREWSLGCSVRLFDTFCSLCLASSSSFASFHVYVCAAFLLQFEQRLLGMDFTQLLLFLQRPPTEAWTSREVEAVIAQAYVYRSWDEKGREEQRHWDAAVAAASTGTRDDTPPMPVLCLSCTQHQRACDRSRHCLHQPRLRGGDVLRLARLWTA